MKKITVSIVTCSILTAALLFVGKYDLSITESLYTPQSLPAQLIEYVGKAPAFFLLSYAATVWSGLLRRGRPSLRLLSIPLSVVAFGAVYFYFRDAAPNSYGAVNAFAAIAFYAPIGFYVGDAPTVTLQKRAVPCVQAACFIVFALSVVTALKLLVDRGRYVDVLQGTAIFSFWYVRGSGGSSFPSGHTAAWACLLALLFFFPEGKKGYGIRYALIVASSALIALGRIIGGYHYPSDTIAAVITCILCYEIVTIIPFRRYGDEVFKLQASLGLKR